MNQAPDRLLKTKRTLDDLAVFGGSPSFDATLYVGRPSVGDVDAALQRIRDALLSRRLSNDGPIVREFEQRVCQLTGAEHAVAVCNATIGIQIAAQALGMNRLGSDSRVIVPSFTYAATAQALKWIGIRPLFCDVDPATHGLDPACVAAAIDDSVTGIIGVHLWGRPCDAELLTTLAKQHDLPVMFDAAQAFGSKLNGIPVGTLGNAEVFSFHATKVVNSFEGGAITTNDGDLADRLRKMRNFGLANHDDADVLGTNGKMSEASAAMGVTSLDSMDSFVQANRSHHRLYQERLSGVRGLRVMGQLADSNCHYVVAELDAGVAGLTRDQLLEVLCAENVAARRYFAPGCHRMTVFAEDAAGKTLPVTESLCERVFQLPTGIAVLTEQIELVCEIIKLCLRHGREVSDRLAESARV